MAQALVAAARGRLAEAEAYQQQLLAGAAAAAGLDPELASAAGLQVCVRVWARVCVCEGDMGLWYCFAVSFRRYRGPKHLAPLGICARRTSLAPAFTSPFPFSCSGSCFLWDCI